MIKVRTRPLYRLAKRGGESFWTLPGAGSPVRFAAEHEPSEKVKDEAGLYRGQRRLAVVGQSGLLGGAIENGGHAGQGAQGRGLDGGARPRVRSQKEARLHRLAKARLGGVSHDRSRRNADRRRVRLAIQPAHPARSLNASRADSHGGQLERHVAGPRRHAEPERLAHQNGRGIQHVVEREFHRQIFSQRPATMAGRGGGDA